MGRFDGVLLTSDFDNTLIYTEHALRTGGTVPALSEENRAALEYFMAEGGKFAIATGRALAAFIKYADQVPMNAPAVLYNGAALYDFEAKAYLETDYLNEAAPARMQEALDRFPEVGVEAYNDALDIPTVQPNDCTRRHQHMAHTGVEEFAKVTDIPTPIGKMLLEGQREELEKAKAYLDAQPWRGEYEIFFSGATLVEVTAKGSNKGNMVGRLAQRLGISMDHVYCVGDETNDISMLTVAKEGFAPANCAQAVKDAGATIVADKNHDALADVIAILDKYYA